MYQQAEITNYEGAVAFLCSHQAEYMEAVQNCLSDRVKLQHTDVLTHSLTILATYGWEKGEDGSFAHDALESLSTRCRVPLEKAGVDTGRMERHHRLFKALLNFGSELHNHLVETLQCC